MQCTFKKQTTTQIILSVKTIATQNGGEQNSAFSLTIYMHVTNADANLSPILEIKWDLNDDLDLVLRAVKLTEAKGVLYDFTIETAKSNSKRIPERKPEISEKLEKRQAQVDFFTELRESHKDLTHDKLARKCCLATPYFSNLKCGRVNLTPIAALHISIALDLEKKHPELAKKLMALSMTGFEDNQQSHVVIFLHTNFPELTGKELADHFNITEAQLRQLKWNTTPLTTHLAKKVIRSLELDKKLPYVAKRLMDVAQSNESE